MVITNVLRVAQMIVGTVDWLHDILCITVRSKFEWNLLTAS